MKTFSPRASAAFSLVEVALALGVAAFCLISVFGLLPVGVNANRTSFEQTGAANVASAIVTDLRTTALVTPPADQTTPGYQIPIPGTPAGSPTNFTTLFVREDGTLSGKVNQNADPAASPHYRVTVYFTSAGTIKTSVAGNPNATVVRILITWPALADADYTMAPIKYSGSFETIAGLIRN